MLTVLQQAEASPRHPGGTSAGSFSGRMPLRDGVIQGIGFYLEGTLVGAGINAANDDAPEVLVPDLRITFPFRGRAQPVTISAALRDLFLLTVWLGGYIGERLVPTAAGAFHSYFVLPLGLALDPSKRGRDAIPWGIDGSLLDGEITYEGTWAAGTEYDDGVTDITAGLLRPTLVWSDEPPASFRMALIPNRNRIAIESAARHGPIRLSRGQSDALFGILYRQEDTSAQADRVDGLVTRLQATHPVLGLLHDERFRELRTMGNTWAKLARALIVAATPEGLDGTALYVANPQNHADGFPDLMGRDIEIIADSAEAVPLGTTDVTPAAGDALHALLLGLVAQRMG